MVDLVVTGDGVVIITQTMAEALICIDWIDEIVGVDGRLAAKGYRSFINANKALDRLATRQDRARQDGQRVIHVRLGFDPSYGDHPKSSPLLAAARDAEILRIETPSTTIAAAVSPAADDIVIVKKRTAPSTAQVWRSRFVLLR